MQPGKTRERLLYIDNLRWFIILLVISMHAADTYSPLGNWYFTDRTSLSLSALLFLVAWQMYLQAFFMGLLFFIAGLFVPSSIDRKGPLRFARERAFRLGLPVLFYMFVLGPVTEYYVAHSWTSTEPTSLIHEWLKHLRNGEFLQENGPLWFCLALLIFSLAYAAFWSRPRHVESEVEISPPTTSQLISFTLALAAITFLVRTPRPAPVLNLHLGDFPQYILLFAAGIVSARKGWLSHLQITSGTRWLPLTLPVGFFAWLIIIWFGGALRGNGNLYSGGWHWQSAAICLWESFTCLGICFTLLVLFRNEFNKQGWLSKFLSENAFSVYVFHPPIVILGARLLHLILWQPLSKFALLTILSATASFVLSAAVFRRIPLLRTIL